jgi:uncharacterized repeat protein (TIGR01451 family)
MSQGSRDVSKGHRTRRRGRALALAVLTALGIVALAGWPAGAPAVPGPTDLTLTKGDSPDPVTQNSTLTYTILVANTGANDATGVTVTDPLPKNTGFVSATASAGTCVQASGTVTCTIGTLLAGTNATVTIQVTPTKSGKLSNTATVASPDDTNAANNSDTEETTVSKAAKKGKASCAAPTITGTPGSDVITGTRKADVINAGLGDDRISSLGGKDLICAGQGFDVVFAGDGNDTVIGGANADRLIGEAGNDTLKGKRGRDRLRGRAGDDFMHGGRGPDSCKGGPGRDEKRSC